jgi:hypothetical protein
MFERKTIMNSFAGTVLLGALLLDVKQPRSEADPHLKLVPRSRIS